MREAATVWFPWQRHSRQPQVCMRVRQIGFGLMADRHTAGARVVRRRLNSDCERSRRIYTRRKDHLKATECCQRQHETDRWQSLHTHRQPAIRLRSIIAEQTFTISVQYFIRSGSASSKTSAVLGFCHCTRRSDR